MADKHGKISALTLHGMIQNPASQAAALLRWILPEQKLMQPFLLLQKVLLKQGVLWAGSDDGLVHVSKDDGKTWTNVTPTDFARLGIDKLCRTVAF